MSMTYGLKIVMLKNVRGHPIVSPPGTILRSGLEYEARSNPNGAISGLCHNGEWLGVAPREFAFLEAPAWVQEIHAKHGHT